MSPDGRPTLETDDVQLLTPDAGPSPRSSSTLRTLMGLILSNALLPLGALLTAPILARSLGPEGRGNLAISQTVVTYASIVVLVGAPRAYTYFVAKRRHGGLLPGIAISGGVLYLAVSASLLMFASPLWGLNNGTTWLIICVLPVTAIADIRRAYLIGLDDYSPSSWERTILATVRIILICGLAALALLDSWTALLATSIASFSGSLALLRPIRVRTQASDATSLRTFASFSFAAFPFMLAGLSNARLDQLLIPILTSASDLGIYVAAVAYVELATYAIAGAETIVGTRTADRYTSADLARILPIVIFVNGVAVVTLLTCAPVLVPLLFGSEFRSALTPVFVLGLGALAYAPNRVLGAAVVGRGRPGLQSVVEWFGVGLTTTGLFLLVPRIGILGAAITSSCVYLATFAGFILVLSRSLGTKARTIVWRRGVLSDVLAIVRKVVLGVARRARPGSPSA